jgi:hypothetical protein
MYFLAGGSIGGGRTRASARDGFLRRATSSTESREWFAALQGPHRSRTSSACNQRCLGIRNPPALRAAAAQFAQ